MHRTLTQNRRRRNLLNSLIRLPSVARYSSRHSERHLSTPSAASFSRLRHPLSSRWWPRTGRPARSADRFGDRAAASRGVQGTLAHHRPRDVDPCHPGDHALPDWGRTRFGEHFLAVERPTIQSNALVVLTADAPMSWVLVRFPGDAGELRPYPGGGRMRRGPRQPGEASAAAVPARASRKLASSCRRCDDESSAAARLSRSVDGHLGLDLEAHRRSRHRRRSCTRPRRSRQTSAAPRRTTSA